jgi:hypothetical protein
MPAAKTAFVKVAVHCSADPDATGWLIIFRGGFQIKFCGKGPAHSVAPKQYHQYSKN